MLDLLGKTKLVPVPDEPFSFRTEKSPEGRKAEYDRGRDSTANSLRKSFAQWRIITSIAAIFAVGVISYSLYDNVMGTLPLFQNGDGSGRYDRKDGRGR